MASAATGMQRRGTSRGSVATLVACGNGGPDHDVELCEADLGRLGYHGVAALGALMDMQTGVPVLVTNGAPQPRAGTGVVRHLVRRPGSLDEFRELVLRLRDSVAANSMYLRLEL